MVDVPAHVQQPRKDDPKYMRNLGKLFCCITLPCGRKKQKTKLHIIKIDPPDESTDQHKKQSHVSLFESHE